MSIWSENPEWFDEWLERQADEGRFDDHPLYGAEIKALVERGDFCGWEWWNRLDDGGKLGGEAMTVFVERLVP